MYKSLFVSLDTTGILCELFLQLGVNVTVTINFFLICAPCHLTLPAEGAVPPSWHQSAPEAHWKELASATFYQVMRERWSLALPIGMTV